MLWTCLPGFAAPWLGYHERRTAAVVIEDCPAVHADRGPPPDGIELVLMRRGAVVQKFFRCGQCAAGPLRKALYDPDGAGLRCRKCARVDHASRNQIANDPFAKVAALRRKIGAPPGFAEPLPTRPRGKRAGQVYDRLAMQILAGEARARRHLRVMLRGLERHVDQRSWTDGAHLRR
jgi:hypothetical protein